MPWYKHGRPLEGYTAVCVGQGPSLVPEQVAQISSIFPTIAVSHTYKWAPDACVIYSCDRNWWKTAWHEFPALQEHKADKVTLDYEKLDTKVPNLYWLKCGGNHGFIFEEGIVAHGRNSGHQAINLAVNMGAERVILLGYDMCVINGKTHCDVPHVPVPHSVFDTMYEAMITAAPLLKKRGIQVINTSLQSRLGCFPKVPFQEAIEWGKYG